MITSRLFIAFVSLAVSFATARAADPVAELASFSVFSNVDLAQLASAEVKPMRGPAMNNTRFQSVQTCWVSPGVPSQVANALRNFNPARHSELKVLLHVNGANFSQVSSLPNDPEVQWLQNATAQKSNELQISKEEAAKTAPFAQFWTQILSSRAAAGVFAQPPYSNTGNNIRAGEEINALMNEQPRIKKQFGGIIGSKGEQYWELLDIDNKGVLTLGASFNKGLQMADVLYYASGGYYAAITLYQLWPVDVGGKASTLVWRGDLLSSGELADLHGVERLGSEAALIKDVAKSVRAFRGESGTR